jgi:alanine-glyoxylate transaminase/serine-glyoxylate transaminase/serine-pyruvate transaminase
LFLGAVFHPADVGARSKPRPPCPRGTPRSCGRAPVEEVARIAREHGALTVVDGVCAVGGEELRQDAWDIDVCLTASQKALGAPPGLALVMAGPRALAARRAKKVPVASLYLDMHEWLPIMEAYERGTPQYFATPPVNLILALDVSLTQLLAEGVAPRVARLRPRPSTRAWPSWTGAKSISA